MNRKLGIYAAAAIVVANMIGTGVFTSTGFQAQSLHDPTTILLAWVVGGVLALCGAAAYAELGAMMPKAGGEYVYLREAYHPLIGFLSGWVSLFAGFSAPVAVAALAFGKYAAAVFPGLGDPWAQKGLAIALVAAMTTLHGVDTVIGGRVQTVLSAGKALLITVFIVAGVLAGTGSWSHFSSHDTTSHLFSENFALALMYVSLAYSGWNAAAYIAGDLENPSRTVPRALLLGTGLVMVLYVFINVVFLYALPIDTLAPPGEPWPLIEVGDASARALFGSTAGTLMSSLISLGLMSAVSAMVMAGPRVYAAMADDGSLPKVLAKRSARGVPWISIVLQGVLASIIIMVGELGEVLRYVGFLLSIFAALAVGAVFVLRFTRPDAPRPYRTWGYPVTPILFIVMAAWVVYAQVRANPDEAIWCFRTLEVGILVWLVSEVVALRRKVEAVSSSRE